MIFSNRYTIHHTRNAQNEPVTEVLDHRKGTASRFFGVYTDDTAVAFLKHLRAECARRRLHA